MRVIVGCEYSGITRSAFRALGHDAWSCDLLPSEDNSEFHIQDDISLLLNENWDLGIFHPPCTYLSVSGLHWNGRTPGRAEKTEAALDFVRLLMGAQIPRIAVENPVSCISTRIRKPDQIIQPWMFGENASKKTCLWLKGLPPLRPTEFVEPRLVCCDTTLPNGVGVYGCPNCCGDKGRAMERWANQCDSGQNKLAPSLDRWKERSRTYQGIANAMAAQWGPAP